MRFKKTKQNLSHLFVARSNIIDIWFGHKGYNGELYDKMLSYFQTKSGISSGTLYDHILATLTGLGYTGTLQDKLASFFDAQVGSKGTRVDNEIAFWQNFTLDFVPFGTIQEDSGNYIKDDSGNFILSN